MNYPVFKWSDESIDKYWSYISTLDGDYFSRFYASELVSLTNANQVSSILDIGCGTGDFLLNALKKNPNLIAYGIESSKNSSQITSSLCKSYKNFKGILPPSDTLRLKDIPGFSLITCFEVLEHLYDDALNSVLDTSYSFLADSGVAVFSVPNSEDLSKSFILNPETYKLFHRYQHVRSFTPDALHNTLKSKFSNVRILETHLGTRKPFPLGLAYKFKSIFQKFNSDNFIPPHLLAFCSK